MLTLRSTIYKTALFLKKMFFENLVYSPVGFIPLDCPNLLRKLLEDTMLAQFLHGIHHKT